MSSEHFYRRTHMATQKDGYWNSVACALLGGFGTINGVWKRGHGEDSGAGMEKRWDDLVLHRVNLRWGVGSAPTALTSRTVSSVKPPT